MDLTALDTNKPDEYTAQAKAEWGSTEAYKEYEKRSKNWKKDDYDSLTQGLMQQFTEFGQIKDQAPDSPEAQSQVKKLQDYITDHMYTCTNEILEGLSHLYDGGGEFTENIDAAGGPGTGEFAAKAIRVYCGKR